LRPCNATATVADLALDDVSEEGSAVAAWALNTLYEDEDEKVPAAAGSLVTATLVRPSAAGSVRSSATHVCKVTFSNDEEDADAAAADAARKRAV
jgi:hypothetical protein